MLTKKVNSRICSYFIIVLADLLLALFSLKTRENERFCFWCFVAAQIAIWLWFMHDCITCTMNATNSHLYNSDEHSCIRWQLCFFYTCGHSWCLAGRENGRTNCFLHAISISNTRECVWDSLLACWLAAMLRTWRISSMWSEPQL